MHRTLRKYCNTYSLLESKYDNICFLNDILFTIRRDAQRQNIRCFFEYPHEQYEVSLYLLMLQRVGSKWWALLVL